jgi:hypothetical protein
VLGLCLDNPEIEFYFSTEVKLYSYFAAAFTAIIIIIIIIIQA